jgi:hypothetical protein
VVFFGFVAQFGESYAADIWCDKSPVLVLNGLKTGQFVGVNCCTKNVHYREIVVQRMYIDR